MAESRNTYEDPAVRTLGLTTRLGLPCVWTRAVSLHVCVIQIYVAEANHKATTYKSRQRRCLQTSVLQTSVAAQQEGF